MQSVEYGRGYTCQFAYFRARWRESAFTRPGQNCSLPLAVSWTRDVYPQRFESRKTGRAGYSPACGNEWVRGICEKPRIKCSECPHQRFLRITDEIIRWHLCGHDDKGREFVMGVYPMLRDETCFFLAA